MDQETILRKQKEKRNAIIAIIGTIILWFIWIFISIADPQGAFNIMISTLLFLPILIILIALTVYKRVKERKSLESLESVTTQQRTSPISVICPHCNNTFQIPQQQKPFRVKCPSCAKESLFK